MPKLVLKDGTGAEREFAVKGEPVTIGKSAECTIRLSGPGVGRLHAIVQKKGKAVVVTDQGAQAGTLVNDSRVEEAELNEGDSLKIGETSLRFSTEDVAEPERPKREILGGIRLSKTQQTVVKVICALTSLGCIFGVVWLLSTRQRDPHVQANQARKTRIIKVDPRAEPEKMFRNAEMMAATAATAEDNGDLDEAIRILEEAEKRMEEALKAWDGLEEKYQGDGYHYLRKQSVDWANKLRGVRLQKFRIRQQKMIYGPGGIRGPSAAPGGAPVPAEEDEAAASEGEGPAP
jgi:pSer/pThr/pTyr-binding forkhead associated (FHA) protein